MRYSVLYCGLFISAFFCTATHAASIEVSFPNAQTTTDAQNKSMPEVFAQEPFSVRIDITSAERGYMQIVSIEGVDQLTRVGVQQFSNTKNINGVFENTQSVIYSFVPSEKGVFKIGPVVVEQNGKRTSSGTFYYKVSQARQQPSTVAQSRPLVQTTMGGPASYAARQNTKPSVACQLTTPNRSVVVGEMIEVGLLMYLSGQLSSLAITPWEMSGFTVKTLPPMPPREEKVNGTIVEVREQKYIATALQPGSYAIGPVEVVYGQPMIHHHMGLMQFMLQNLGAEERRAIQTNTLTINVEPLPSHKGVVNAVGQIRNFSLIADKTTALVNEPIKLTVIVEGKADLAGIQEPKLLLPASFKSYKSKSNVNDGFINGSYHCRREFEFIVQIPRSGEHEIPAQKFVYFDTIDRVYKTLSSNVISITVEQDPEQPAAVQHDVSSKKSDKQSPVNNEHKQSKDDSDLAIYEHTTFGSKPLHAIPWWLLVMCLLLPLYFVRDWLRQLWMWLINRSSSSHAKQKRIIAALEAELNAIIKKQDASLMYPFFVRASVALLGIAAHAAFDTELELYAREKGLAEDQIQALLEYLSVCASMQFITHAHAQQTALIMHDAQRWFLVIARFVAADYKK